MGHRGGTSTSQSQGGGWPWPPDCRREGLKGLLREAAGLQGLMGRPAQGQQPGQEGSQGRVDTPANPRPASENRWEGHRCWPLPELPETQSGGTPGQWALSLPSLGAQNPPGEILREQLFQSLPCSSLSLPEPSFKSHKPPASTPSLLAPLGPAPSAQLLPSELRGVRGLLEGSPPH